MVSDNLKMERSIFIIGASSKLSQSIREIYSEDKICDVYRDTYTSWIGENSQNIIQTFFENRISNNSIIFITAAILNPKTPFQEVFDMNYNLPVNIIESLTEYNPRIVTLGTILEKLGPSNNNYVSSKIKLSTKIESLIKKNLRITHFRLHTLYGKGYPNEFMFLGQIFYAIKNKTDFHMSSGEQIREYHHYDDVVSSINTFLDNETSGIVEITFGNGMAIKDLAIKIFDFFEKSELLKIGSKNLDFKEKFQNDYKKNEDIKIDFKEPISGITKYLKTII